jgi:general secretion pathway protein K
MVTMRKKGHHNDGFALISVVWTVLLLSLAGVAILTLTIGLRRSVDVLEHEASDKPIAESAIEVFMYRYFLEGEEQIRNNARFDVLGYGVEVDVRFEQGRINLNNESAEVLSAAFASKGIEVARAQQLAAAIVDWRDEDDEALEEGAEQSDYEAAGRFGPRNGWFESLGELLHVYGMDKSLFLCVQPLFTVHSRKGVTQYNGSTYPYLAYAPSEVVEVFEWAFENDWLEHGWPDPLLATHEVDLGSGGGAIAGQAVRILVRIDNDRQAKFVAVLRLLSKSGTHQEYRTIQPVIGAMRAPAGAECTYAN